MSTIVSVMFSVADVALIEQLRERFRAALPLELTVMSSLGGVLVRGEYDTYILYDAALEAIVKEVDNG